MISTPAERATVRASTVSRRGVATPVKDRSRACWAGLHFAGADTTQSFYPFGETQAYSGGIQWRFGTKTVPRGWHCWASGRTDHPVFEHESDARAWVENAAAA